MAPRHGWENTVCLGGFWVAGSLLHYPLGTPAAAIFFLAVFLAFVSFFVSFLLAFLSFALGKSYMSSPRTPATLEPIKS